MKKLISLVLALAMVALCGAALADSLTVTGVVSTDHTYTAYQIFTGTKASDSENLGDVAFGTGITPDGQEALYNYYSLTGDNKTVQKLVEAIAAYSGTETQKAQHFAAFFETTPSYLTGGVNGTIANGNATWTGLNSGYYFIKDTYTGSGTEGKDYSVARVAVQVVGDTSIQNKADKPTLEKEASDASVEVGEVVTFTLNSKVPDTQEYSEYVMTFSDYMTSGLTLEALTNFSVTIGGTTLASTAYTLESSTKTFGTGDDAVTRNGFTLAINMLNDDVNHTAKYTYNAPIVITYHATVNENAISRVEENYAELEYNNNPSNSTSKGKTPPDIEKVYNAKINVVKVDGTDQTTPLSGAKFVLRVKTLGTTAPHQSDIAVGKYYHYNETTDDVEWVTVTDESTAALLANTGITIAETDAQGHAYDVFKGLEDGTYELIEIQAPQGYNLLTTPTDVTIAGSDADASTLVYSSTVLNNQGTELPSTGGIGTTIFYIVGGMLLVGAAIVLVARRKASDN